MHWPSHVKGLQIKLLLSYNDASMGEWKLVLDCWLARTREGRGAAFANYRIKDLIHSNSGRRTHLPKIFIAALQAVRELTLIPMNPVEVTSREEAWAEPFWASWRIDMRGFQHVDFWQSKVDVNRIGDAMDFSLNRIVTGEECAEGWINHLSDTQFVKVSPVKYVKKDYLSKQWDRMINRIPGYIVRAANSLDSVVIGQGISMTAYNMMKKMGWTGGPLKGGMLAHPPTPEGNRSREMLGYKVKTKRSKVVAYISGEGEVVYGQEREGLIKRYELNPLGNPVPTGENVPWHSGAKPVLRWKGAIKGIAEFNS